MTCQWRRRRATAKVGRAGGGHCRKTSYRSPMIRVEERQGAGSVR